MDYKFIQEHHNKLQIQQPKEGSTVHNSGMKDQKYKQYIESDFDNGLQEETFTKEDFRYHIEQSFMKSRANREYNFPRFAQESESEESFRSMRLCGVYDLHKQHFSKQPKEQIKKYKTPSTELYRPKDPTNPKNKRLKTEGNEKCEESTMSFHFQSNSDSGRSEDAIRLGNKQTKKHAAIQTKQKVVKGQSSNQSYQLLLKDLQNKMQMVNKKENSRHKTVPSPYENSKPNCFNDCDRIYGQSKRALKRTISNRRYVKTGPNGRPFKTSQGHYESLEFQDTSNYNTKVKSDSNSTAHQSQFYTQATSVSKNRPNVVKHNTEVTPVQMKSTQKYSLNTMPSESRPVGLSKAYLQPNTNQTGKYRGNVKRPETQQDISRPQAIISQTSLTHEYLLQILNQQKPNEPKRVSKVQNKTNVQNPVFNLNNSNINLNLNFQGPKQHNRTISDDLMQQTMEVISRQSKSKIAVSKQKDNVRSISSQYSRNAKDNQRFNTDPDETERQKSSQQHFFEIQAKMNLPKRNVQKSQSRCNTEQQYPGTMNPAAYLKQMQQTQKMQKQNMTSMNSFFQSQIVKPTRLKSKFQNLKIHVDC